MLETGNHMAVQGTFHKVDAIVILNARGLSA